LDSSVVGETKVVEDVAQQASGGTGGLPRPLWEESVLQAASGERASRRIRKGMREIIYLVAEDEARH
jgi:hypothetical protein